MHGFAQALGNFGDPGIWLWIVFGILWGIVFSVIPGIGPLEAMALFLAFAFGMNPMYALATMVALNSVGATGGSITAILMGVPGETPNVATVYDGFPMTKKGQGARALGAALTASAMGGAAPVFLALGMVVVLVPLVLALTSMDMVFVILIGLSFIVVLGKGSMIKGLISGGLGLLLAAVGLSPTSGLTRFTFGSDFLYDGLHIVPVFLGLFAVPAIVELALKGGGGTIAKTQGVAVSIRDVSKGALDVFRHWRLWLRSSLIGYVVGVTPGIGASSGAFIAYAEAKRRSKHPELFGTGVVEGVIAPESANNAVMSGSLLTTLAVGVPGSAGGALILGAIMVLGLVPGPTMIREHLALSLTMLMIVAVANIIGAGICFGLVPQLAKIAIIPGRILVPLVLCLIYVGALAYEGQFLDMVAMLVLGAVGVVFQHFGYNSAALVLGFVLGELFEKYLFIGLQLAGPLFFLRPISLVLILILISLFAWGPVERELRRRLRRGRAA